MSRMACQTSAVMKAMAKTINIAFCACGCTTEDSVKNPTTISVTPPPIANRRARMPSGPRLTKLAIIPPPSCVAIATTLSASIARAEYIVAKVKEKNLESGASYRKPMMVVIAAKPAVRESNCAILFLRSVSLRNPVRAKPVNVKQSALLNDIRVRFIVEPASSWMSHEGMGMSQAPRYWLSVSTPASATSAPQNRAARRLDTDF
jgi:hypothetical protein